MFLGAVLGCSAEFSKGEIRAFFPFLCELWLTSYSTASERKTEPDPKNPEAKPLVFVKSSARLPHCIQVAQGTNP